MTKTIRILLLSLAAMSLVACGSSSSDDSGDAAWSYTSGNGDVIKLDHRPKRIIASAAEAAGLMQYGIKPVAIYLAQDLDLEPGLEGVDLDGIEIIGQEWGKIDAEKAAQLKPDLIVGDWWPPQKAYQGFEEGADKASLKVAELAPVIGANQEGSLEDVVQWYEGFAKSLGVDVDDAKYAAGKKRYAEAKAAFQQAVKAKPGLTALAVAPGADLLYVAVPKYSTSLTDFKDWGLDVIDPDSPKADFPYWEYLSWEKADKYQPDLLLIDDRGYDSTIDVAEKQPTWDKIKAAQARAYTPWPGYWVHTYDAYANQLEQLTRAVEKADPGIA